MAKKLVIDIFPPEKKEAPVVFQNFQERKEEMPEQVKEIRQIQPEKKKSERSKSWLTILLLFILISAGGFCYFKLAKATITVWPKTEDLNVTTSLTVNKGVSEPDFTAKVIPGEMFEKEKVVTDTFSSTGKTGKEQKAGGTITVYNEYSASSQALVANTRFVSTNGKVFRTQSKITIPGFHYDDKKKIVAGTIDVKVLADQAGPDYNIGPSTFSIPGFAGSEKYTKFYGKSSQAMTGGSSEKVSQVTKEDLDNAKITLSKKTKEDCESSFMEDLNGEKASAGFIFLEKAVKTDVVDTFSLAVVGTQGDNFSYQVKAKSQTIIFKKADLVNFTKQFVLSQSSEGKTVLDKSIAVKITPETVNLDSGKLILSLEISSKTYSDINSSNLKEGLKGKTAMESRVSLENFPNIAKVEVKLWPFWVRKIPDDLEKIQINLNVD
jgi:hypothetical protein